MQTQHLGFREVAIVAVIALFAFNGLAKADPPSRVARIGLVTGAVSFSPAVP